MADERQEANLHCVRCHVSFKESENSGTACRIEHDYENFEGRRDGNWYEGTLACCGAFYRFQRHCEDEFADPASCFLGLHTVDPSQVQYSHNTIQICDPKRCGRKLHEQTKLAQQEQEKLSKSVTAGKRAAEQEDKQSKRARIDSLKKEGKRREARLLRAELLGLDCPSEELDSDVDPDGCHEFDYASDSSLVPPF